MISTRTSLKLLLTICASLVLTLSFAQPVAAQSGSTATPCPSDKICVGAVNGKMGTCKVPDGTATNDEDKLTGEATHEAKRGTLVNPLKVDSVEDLLEIVLDAAITIGTYILILALIWIGFLFVAARGNEEKLRNAKSALFWVVIGGVILLGAKGIASVIQSTATDITNF